MAMVETAVSGMAAMTDYISPDLRPLAKPIDDYHLDPANARINHDVDRIAASLSQYGQRTPIVVNTRENGKIEKGNGTWKAAKALGWSHIAVVTEDDDPMTAVGYGISDNRTGDLSGWDIDILDQLISSLDDDVFTGFKDGEWEEILEREGVRDEHESHDADPQISRADELQEKWGVELGQVWRLPSRDGEGEHRIICGDCTDRGVVDRVMGGVVAGLGIHDPPYGIKRDKGFGGAVGFSGNGKPIPRRVYDDTWDESRPIDFGLIIGDSKKAIIWGGNFFTDLLPVGGHWLVWDKNNTMPTFGDCELAWTSIDRNSIKKYEIEYNGLIGKEKERFHPTQKPVALYEAVLGDYSELKETINDFYLGSGTALIASENLNRYCRGIEKNPPYVAVTLQRYVDAFGIEPELIK